MLEIHDIDNIVMDQNLLKPISMQVPRLVRIPDSKTLCHSMRAAIHGS